MGTDLSIRRVILPLDGTQNEEQLLLPATVLASWFGARLQITTTDRDDVERYSNLSAGLGLPVEPVAAFDGVEPLSELVALLSAQTPSVAVAEADDHGLALAVASDQATFLVASGRRNRLATGPLVVGVWGYPSDTHALALAATWAQALDLQVRLAFAVDPSADDVGTAPRISSSDRAMLDGVNAARCRLEQLGIEAEIDRIRSGEGDAAIMLARSREATAVVIPADMIGDGTLVKEAVDLGVSVLVAPVVDEPPRRPIEVTKSGPRHERTSLSEALPDTLLGDVPVDEVLVGEAECLDLLAGEVVARLGYVDDGWPVVVPVNFAVEGGDIFLRSVPGAKVHAAQRGEIVCLEADRIDAASRSGWSVLVHGPLEVITDPTVLRVAWDHDPTPWLEAETWQWLRLRPLSITGRRIGPSAMNADERKDRGSQE